MPSGAWNRLMPDEPEWMKKLPTDAMLNAKEIVSLFGYSSTNSLHHAVRKAQFPEADKKFVSHSGATRCYWSVHTIRAEIKRRKQTCKSNQGE